MKNKFSQLFVRYPELNYCKDSIIEADMLLLKTAKEGGTIFTMGNGGSAADSDHIVGELMKSFIKKRELRDDYKSKLIKIDKNLGKDLSLELQEGIRSISLTQHTSLSTAFANDVNPYLGFAQQLSVLSRIGDSVVCISTSGNSKNIIYAAIVAKAKGLKVIGLTGKGGGTLRDFCDICIDVNEKETYKVQELHLPIYHALCISLEDEFWHENIHL
ncbi:MAG: SIS domain-containing protein [Peptostreptococcaceae bacterium]|nr:SIS domain-containing protein [Peptostreptococcaceae bacterium]